MKKSPDRRARASRRNGKLGGRPAGEPTCLVRIYETDAAALPAHGRSAAQAVRALLTQAGS